MTSLEKLNLNILKNTHGAEDFYNRLKKNRIHLKKWHTKNNFYAYRVYDADLPDFAFAIDVYQEHNAIVDNSYLHIQEYAPTRTIDPEKAEQRRGAAQHICAALWAIPLQQVVLKTRQRQKGLSQYEKHDERHQFFNTLEQRAIFRINLYDYLDTGLFLDSRGIRLFIANQIADKSFLNLFCYTATASVQAALAQAKRSVSVDMSNTYIDWAAKNFQLNHINRRQHLLVQADCLEWLKNNTEKFDCILLDPPSFSNSKRMQGTLDIERDQVELITHTMNHLNHDGQLIFVTNKQKFKLDAALIKKFVIENITMRTMPDDFKRYKAIHQAYVIKYHQ